MTTPQEENVVLKTGDRAPAFSLPAHPTGTISLSDFHAKKNVILAFYPKDDTPGCTKEMCGFSDDQTKFAELDTIVLGISCDLAESHGKFATKYGLNLTLLADADREVGQKFGAIRGDRKMADRILFLIDKEGVIRHIHEGMPKLPEILEKVRAL